MVTDPATPRALAFGEALIDEFPDRRVVAGAPLHVAARLASLGWTAYLVTRIGQDDDGLHIAETLRRHGVDTSLVEIDGDLPTGTTVIELGEGDHSFTITRPVAWDAIQGPDPVPAHGLLYFGTLALRDQRSRSALTRILESSTAIRVVDINLRPPDYDRDTVALVVGACDILKTNEEEFVEVCSLLEVPAEPASLHHTGPEWVCITRGSAGASLHHRDGGSWEAPGIDIEVVDTVGAGDAFTATLVDGLVREHDPGEVVAEANRQAAATAARRGGLPEGD